MTSTLLAVPFLKANVVFSTDDFQQVDYSTVLTFIGGLSSGRGWDGGWNIMQETSNLRITIEGLRITRGTNSEVLRRAVVTGL